MRIVLIAFPVIKIDVFFIVYKSIRHQTIPEAETLQQFS
jgi:hypothetical protein